MRSMLWIYVTSAARAVASILGTIQSRQTTNCSELELIIARGTTEPPNPTYGIIVGDPLFAATQKLIPQVTGYAVNYPASFDCNSRDLGVNDTLTHLATASAACPQQEYVLVGYSQGADVMHFAAPSIDPSLYPRIVALVMFGDPGNRGPGKISPLGGTTPVFPDALAAKLKENCAEGDPVCTNNGTNVDAHLSYNNAGTTYIADSATYIQTQFQTGGQAGPSPGTPPGTGDNTAALSSLGALLGSPTTSCPSSTSAVPVAPTKRSESAIARGEAGLLEYAVRALRL